jgi:site-specific recombinase XerD
MAKLPPFDDFDFYRGLNRDALDAIRKTIDTAAALRPHIEGTRKLARQNDELIRRTQAVMGTGQMLALAAAVEKMRPTIERVQNHFREQGEAMEQVWRTYGTTLRRTEEAIAPQIEAFAKIQREHAAATEGIIRAVEGASRSWQALIERSGLGRLRDSGTVDPTVAASTFPQLQQWAAEHAGAFPPIRELAPDRHGVELDGEEDAAWSHFSAKAEALASADDADADDFIELTEAAVAAAAAKPTDSPQATATRKALVRAALFAIFIDWIAKDLPSPIAVLTYLMMFITPIAPPATSSPTLFVPPAVVAPALYAGPPVPNVIAAAGERARERFSEFFTVHLRNDNTRAAYARAVGQFCSWLDHQAISLKQVQPVVVAMYIEELQHAESASTTRQALSAIRMMFDFLVVGQVLPFNPAASVRGPKDTVKRGKTSVISDDETRALIDSIDTSKLIGLRDRALIGVMAYSLARVSATTSMRVSDYFKSGKRAGFRLHETDGTVHEVPAHHKAEAYLDEYIAAAGISYDAEGPLFRSFEGRTGNLQRRAMHRNDVLRMVYRRAIAAGIDGDICCHTFRATGITKFLQNGGSLEVAQQIANHSSPRTTKLYDQTTDELTADEIERIHF